MCWVVVVNMKIDDVLQVDFHVVKIFILAFLCLDLLLILVEGRSIDFLKLSCHNEPPGPTTRNLRTWIVFLDVFHKAVRSRELFLAEIASCLV